MCRCFSKEQKERSRIVQFVAGSVFMLHPLKLYCAATHWMFRGIAMIVKDQGNLRSLCHCLSFLIQIDTFYHDCILLKTKLQYEIVATEIKRLMCFFCLFFCCLGPECTCVE